LTTFFNLLYHQFAWSYDWVADVVSIGRWKTWIYSAIPYLGEGRVLELGCGPGHLLASYSSDNRTIFGLDTSMQMLRQSSRNLSKFNQEKNLVLAMAQELPFRDESFPVIVSTFPSNFIYDPGTLDQAWRVLQEDGQLIVLPAAWITGSNILDRCAAWVFNFTGESPEVEGSDLEIVLSEEFKHLSQVGFQVSQELIESERSQVLLIRAVKSRSNNS
jgi:ubiquinone/menaquinone biosynthesis C-methylase UbiE